MAKKLTKKEFINKAKKKYGNKYDYSKVEYVNSQTKVCIICPIHGEFLIIPASFLYGHGCPKCGFKARADTKRLKIETFLEKAKKTHGDKYDYSKVNYINSYTKVCIICPEHGEFWQTPYCHLSGQGCPKCGFLYIKKIKTKNINEMLEKAKEVHGDKYDYSKVIKTEYRNKVCIVCSEHGEFWQTLDNHLQGHGCPKCAGVSKVTIEEFIEKAKEVHGNNYDYSKVIYINNKTSVCIICSEHGEFWQTPVAHIYQRQGCPKCQESKLEKNVRQHLLQNNIVYEYQKRFKWLGKQSLDFYLPDYNVAIECQGIQHFKPIEHFGGEEEFKLLQMRDKKKKELCNEHNIKILYYSFLKYKNMFNDINKLINEIKNDTKII